jgi:hypothetical protein
MKITIQFGVENIISHRIKLKSYEENGFKNYTMWAINKICNIEPKRQRLIFEVLVTP